MRGKLFGIICLIFTASFCQEMKVNGGFLQDSLKIGEPVEYWLSARYPFQYDLILPDSNFNFAPFEFVSRKYFETIADSSIALDSVVYALHSFEIDSIQYLNLPALLLVNGDSAIGRSPMDSIFLIHLVPVATDSTKLITNTDLQDLPTQINSPLLMIIGGVLILIALIILIVFGNKIRRHFKLKRMAKAHKQFAENMESYIDQLKGSEGKSEVAEGAINLWKKYLEKLEKQPFTKMTSKEIIQYNFAEELREPLKAVDRCVYGKLSSDKVYQDFQHLEDFAQNRYESKVKELKQGK